MINRQLSIRLDEAVARVLRVRRLRRLACCWAAAACVAIVLLLLAIGGVLTSVTYWPVLAVLAVVAAMALALFTRADRSNVAHLIEQKFPALEARLLTAVEQQPQAHGLLRPLQRQVIDEAIEHACREDWRTCVSKSEMNWATSLHAMAAILFVGALAGLGFADRRLPKLASTAPEHKIAASMETIGAPTIDPGDTSIERGRSLLVLARFADDLPADMVLVYGGTKGDSQSISMSKSLNDPVFGGRIPQVDESMSYRVEYDRYRSRDYKVTVFDYPKLERADATIHFPEYTRLPDELIEDTRQVSAVEGSVVNLRCRLNKPVATARLVATDDNTIIELRRSAESTESVYETDLSPAKKQRYRLELVDTEGRPNQEQPEFLIDVLPNKRPELHLAFPGRDLRVSPIEELSLQGITWDDYGVEQYGVAYNMADGTTEEVSVGERSPRNEKRELSHLLAFEPLQVHPGQLMSYYLYADDFGPDGKLRRTFSDMYFAEVRPFEEIFREGEQQPPGEQPPGEMEGQPQQQVAELLELQKQIISATWNLVRREELGKPSDLFVDDTNVIKESQESALSQLAESSQEFSTAESRRLAEEINGHMTRAVESLAEAADGISPASLPKAVSAEQAAYQGLLALQSHEFEVVRGQPGSRGAASAAGRAQQQLQQLELSNQQDRYETERAAANREADGGRREQLQLVNRLRELARRQEALNQLYKELETALRKAETEEEKEELQRRLKRLREQQVEMLRDLDELRNRMEQPENLAQTAQEREQLEQTRSNVRRASEALEQGQISQALSSGTRAERELDKLQDEFRKKTSGQFSEEMRELRDAARELAEREQEIAEKLQDDGQNNRNTLRKSTDSEDVSRAIEEQQDTLNDLAERMRRTTEEAQTSEPVLSKRLYEAIRKLREQNPQEALEVTKRLLDNGLPKEAIQTESVARQGIDELRRGVEQAAEGVLGNEVEALKRAQEELEDLAKAVASELRESEPGEESERAPGASRNSNQQEDQLASASTAGNSQSREQNANQRNAGRNPSERGEPSENSPSGGSPQQESDGQQPSGGSSPSPSEQASESAGEEAASGQSPGGSQSGGQRSSPNESQDRNQSSEGSQQRDGNQQRGGNQQQDRGEPSGGNQPRSGNRSGGNRTAGGFLESFREQAATGAGAPGGPITGRDYDDWSDRMREVEEMLEDPKLQAEAAQIRDRARSMRVEFKRHSKEPNWDLVSKLVLEPMVDLQRRLDEEISRRESKDAMVPIDRDPVPKRFEQLVRQYYEQLGSGR